MVSWAEGGTIPLPLWVFGARGSSGAPLSGPAKVLLMYYWSRADAKSKRPTGQRHVFVALRWGGLEHKAVADLMDLDIRNVGRHFAALVDAGLVARGHCEIDGRIEPGIWLADVANAGHFDPAKTSCSIGETVMAEMPAPGETVMLDRRNRHGGDARADQADLPGAPRRKRHARSGESAGRSKEASPASPIPVQAVGERDNPATQDQEPDPTTGSMPDVPMPEPAERRETNNPHPLESAMSEFESRVAPRGTAERERRQGPRTTSASDAVWKAATSHSTTFSQNFHPSGSWGISLGEAEADCKLTGPLVTAVLDAWSRKNAALGADCDAAVLDGRFPALHEVWYRKNRTWLRSILAAIRNPAKPQTHRERMAETARINREMRQLERGGSLP
jgi:hypothetical protein